MFTAKVNQRLQQTGRYGKVDAPSVSEDTLEKFNDLYNRSVEGAHTIHALVLGATPELRDIVLSYGHTLTTVDRVAEALAAKSKLMHYRNHPHETIVISDWLKMDFPHGSFDVILGDGVLTALDQDQQKTLLDKLHYVLKPTGHLLLREGAVIHSRPRYAPAVHIHEFRTGQYNLFDLFFGLRLYNANFQAIDVHSRKTYLKDFVAKIAEYQAKGLLSSNEQSRLIHVAEELEHTLLRKEDLENLLRSTFYAKDVIHDIGSGHLSPWYFFLTQPNDPIELPKHVPARVQTKPAVGAPLAPANQS